MPKAEVFFLFEIFFIVGVLGASIFYYFDVKGEWLIIFLAVLFIIISLSLLKLSKKKKLITLLTLSSFLLGFFYFSSYTLSKFSSDQFLLSLKSGREEIKTKVQVISPPLFLGHHQKFLVKPLFGSGKAIVFAGPEYKLGYGDQLILKGEIRSLQGNYYFKDNISTEIEANQVKIIGKNRGNKILAFLYRLKEGIEKRVSHIFRGDEASFYNGLLFGERKTMSQDFKEALKRSGTIHLVALSGYNISIISVYFLNFLIFLGLSRGIAFWPAIVGIFLFVLMTGVSSSCLRAAIMGSLYLISQKIGRISEPKYLLAFAAFLMILLNPKIAFFDIGFQLSFLATIGLFYLYPLLKDFSLRFVRKKIKKISLPSDSLPLLDDFFITISAQFMVLPLIIFYFGYLPLASFFANTLILPIVPILMVSSFLVALIGYLNYYLAIIVSYLLEPLWAYLKEIIYFTSRFVFFPGRIFLLFFTVIYLFILFLLFRRKRKEG